MGGGLAGLREGEEGKEQGEQGCRASGGAVQHSKVERELAVGVRQSKGLWKNGGELREN